MPAKFTSRRTVFVSWPRHSSLTHYAVALLDGARSNIFNVTVQNNTLDEGMKIFQPDSSTGAASGVNNLYLLNRWADGRMRSDQNHPPFNPAERHRITSTSDTIASTDQWVAVRITSADSSFSLPSSAVEEHSITIYNDQLQGTRKVTITPPSGSIQPGSVSTYDIVPNALARFQYRSGTWYRN
jgi:hypothetical protein